MKEGKLEHNLLPRLPEGRHSLRNHCEGRAIPRGNKAGLQAMDRFRQGHRGQDCECPASKTLHASTAPRPPGSCCCELPTQANRQVYRGSLGTRCARREKRGGSSSWNAECPMGPASSGEEEKTARRITVG